MSILNRSGATRAVRQLAAIVLVTAAVSTSGMPEASAQKPSPKALAEARQRYEKGKQLYSEGALDAAIAELQRSYELAPSYKILYNIALVQRARNDFAGALLSYEKYIADGGKEVPSSRRQEVQKELDTLKTLVARVDVTANSSDIDIAIDDVPTGKSSLSGHVLNPGRHRITALRDGRQLAVKVIKVAGGDQETVELEVPDQSSPQPSATDSSTTDPPPSDTSTTSPTATESSTGAAPPPPPSRGPVWIGWAVTGALAVGAGVTGGLAMSAAGSHAELRKKADVTADELDASRSGARTLALVTDILIPCAIVAGAVSLYFSVRTAPGETTGQSTLHLGASPVIGPNGVMGAAGSLSGIF